MDFTGGDEEFYVSSSSRPFQYKSGNGKYVSQFFPGGSSEKAENNPVQEASRPLENAQPSTVEKSQLGELRHTRDKLKLNLPSTNGAAGVSVMCNPAKQGRNDEEEEDPVSEDSVDTVENLNGPRKSSGSESQPACNNIERETLSFPSVKLSPSEAQGSLEAKASSDSTSHDLE